ncbi:MAG: hypothetical protein JWN40_280 [Phycisphaerales bacterium]|jgi:hypothetical protein|nr:hypothetical protein [Phycisphaerales bacterium]
MQKSDGAENVRVGLTGLLDGPSVFSPDRPAVGGGGAAVPASAAMWIGEALGETIERLRRMGALRAALSGGRRRVAE